MKVKEFYKTVNQIGRWIHKPMYILRLSAPDRDDAVEMTIEDVIDALQADQGDFWVMIKGSKDYAPSDLPEINELIKAIREQTSLFVLLYQDALKSTKHIEGHNYLELFLRDTTQENLDKIPSLHNHIGDTLIYLNTREEEGLVKVFNLNYPKELGLLCALPDENTNYINRALDMNRIGFMLPSSRWQVTVRMYTIMKDGRYFPEVRSKLISFFVGEDKSNKSYKRKRSIIGQTEKNL